jgi:hypothetical protein
MERNGATDWLPHAILWLGILIVDVDDVQQPGDGAADHLRQDRDLAALGLCGGVLLLPRRMVCFWLIFITLMLPVEVRIIPTFEVMVNLGPDQQHGRA